jgi:pyruvate kinase
MSEIRAERGQFSVLGDLIEELAGLRSAMIELEGNCINDEAAFCSVYRRSAKNLLHYLALRQHDLRSLQDRLASLGLSSLGRAESHVLASIEAVLGVLRQLVGGKQRPAAAGSQVGFEEGRMLLDEHTERLLGQKPDGRDVRIMVTVPSEAARDYLLVRELLINGMDLMRINCAYDDKHAWKQMIDNLNRAKKETGRQCRILMDLAGPKLRTGPMEPGPQVIKWRPARDSFGNVTAPARIWLTAAENAQLPPSPTDACLPVSGDLLSRLEPGAQITFSDARGASRSMKITEVIGENRWAESVQTAYVHSGATLYVSRNGKAAATSRLDYGGKVAKLPAAPQSITLNSGDELVLSRESGEGRPAIYDEQGRLIAPATIGITLPEILSDVLPGEAIWLDDGKIGGIIRSADDNRMTIEITHARAKGEKLCADKGINLPDSNLRLPSLTAKDLGDLPFIARNADLVGFSFVRSESDVRELQDHLKKLDGEDLGIVLKIETRKAFERLPNLLLAAMGSRAAGVMIARGDLAVECGYQRMAEVQEEILWIAEAAHMPVIWATQVLERLAKEGMPSRAEITDAAMGERAECVMLNKGPYIVSAVRALDDILRRMQSHQSKKSSMLRRLSLAAPFAGSTLAIGRQKHHSALSSEVLRVSA